MSVDEAVARDDSLMAVRRLEIARAIRPHAPGLARAIGRPTPLESDTAVIFMVLRRAADPNAPEEERDMLRYGAHNWIVWLLWDGESPSMAHALNRALKPLRVQLVGRDKVWEFEQGELTDSLLVQPWRNEWRERVFLEWMENLCEYAGKGFEWQQILQRGDLFLGHRPRSPRAPEVLLHMAEAHETYWSVAMSDSYGGYKAVGVNRQNAPEHRRKAIELYERYLKLRPNAPERNAIRKRLVRIRANIDTGFQKYMCLSDC